MKRFFRRMAAVVLTGIGVSFFVYCWLYFPILTGWVAKGSCSAVFLSHRDPEAVKDRDFGRWPFRLVHIRVAYADSTVTASIAGLARRTAIYRQGLGATLLSGTTARELREQPVTLPTPRRQSQDSIPWPQGDLHADSLLPDVEIRNLMKGNMAPCGGSTPRAVRTHRVGVFCQMPRPTASPPWDTMASMSS